VRIVHKREIGEKTGNGWENGKPVEGVFVCWPSVLLQGACPPWQGACPPHPPSQGGAECTPTVRRMVVTWSPHVRRMIAACSPHDRRMIAAWTPHGRRMVAAWSSHGQDGALYNFCSICYNSDKERKRET